MPEERNFQPRSRKSGWSIGVSVAAVWMLLWSGLALAFDGAFVFFTVKTVLAQSYPSVPGEITHSDVRREFDGEGNAFQAEVRYRYEVGEREFVGERLHFFGFRKGSAHPAKNEAANFAVGQPVDVFYKPTDPSDAALERTLDGRVLFIPLFLLPFNLVLVGGWSWVACRVAGVRSLPLRRDADRWLVLPTNGQPLLVAMLAAGLLSILSIIVLGFGGWSGNLGSVAATWAILIGLSAWAFTHTRSLVLREPPSLILDDRLGTVTWPASDKAPELSLPRSRLLGIEIDDSPQTDHDDEGSWNFSIVLKFVGDDGQPSQRFFAQTTSGTEAAALADWVEEWAELKRPPV